MPERLGDGKRIYLANVGVNTEHSFTSPIFEDNTFEFLPIPEDLNSDSPHAVRYRDLRSYYDPDRNLCPYIPHRFWNTVCHNDPEFETFTYGDICDDVPRASALKKLKSGDILLFLAGLECYIGSKRTGRYGFYLIGGLQIDSVIRTMTQPPDGCKGNRFAKNAHVVRGKITEQWDGDWVFGGSNKSCRFHRAVPVNRPICDKVFRAANGSPWQWNSNRSDLQVIGSYTRTCRCVLDTSVPEQKQRAAILGEWIAKWEPSWEM